MGLIQVSGSAPMQAEVAKQVKATQSSAQNSIQHTAHHEQAVLGNPYGADGMKLSDKEDYNAMSTILPNSELEKAKKELEQKKKQKKKKKKKQKKENFWQWLFAK